jgi:hypothetical protein
MNAERHCLDKIRNLRYLFSIDGICSVRSAKTDRDDEKLCLFGPLAHNSLRESTEGGIFLFFARKLLKSLDSEKEMKGNESEFPFISFHFLARTSRAGCAS